MNPPFKFFLVAFVILLPVMSQAQLKDTILYSLQQKPRFFINLTTFNSVVSGGLVTFTGFRAGINYNKRVKFGAGFYGLNTKVITSISVKGANDQPYETNAELKLGFFSLSAEYIFFHNYPWQFSFIPFQVSLGEGHYEYVARNDSTRTKTPRQSIVLFEPSVNGQYSIFRWIGIHTSVGYRFSLYSAKELQEDLSAPTFSFSLRLFVDELFKMAFPHGLKKRSDAGINK